MAILWTYTGKIGPSMRILPEVVGSGVCSSSGIRALKPFPELLLQAVERLLELWLVVRCPATRRDVILSRATTDPKFSGNLLGTSPQLVEPEHRRYLFRLQHRLPPRILNPQRP